MSIKTKIFLHVHSESALTVVEGIPELVCMSVHPHLPCASSYIIALLCHGSQPRAVEVYRPSRLRYIKLA